jgi:serpin B
VATALPRRRAWPLATLALATVLSVAQARPEPAASPDELTPAALADLGLSLLRQSGPVNAVVSPVATAAALGMVHAGTAGAAEREIESLFGRHRPGVQPVKARLPALLKQIGAGSAPSSFVMAGRVWIDTAVAPSVPAAYTQRMASRYQADAARLSFGQSEPARLQINTWTAQHTAGRVADLMPPGSISRATQLVLTSAIHFRSPWEQPFDAAQTEPRPFQTALGTSVPVPTLADERLVRQARVGGTQVYELPFASPVFALLIALPAEGSDVATLLKGASGLDLARWQAALQAQKCRFELPKFTIAPKAAPLKSALESLGVKTVFTNSADLRPMLGRTAHGVHLGELFQAAGITIDEQGGEAVAAAAATVQAKALVLPAPPCAVDRPFVFAVMHRPTGTPLFLGRVGDPSRTE